MTTAFDFFAAESVGVLYGTWWFDDDAPATTTTQVDLEGLKVYRRAASTMSPLVDGATPLTAGLVDRIVNELLLNPLFQVQDHDWIGVLKQ